MELALQFFYRNRTFSCNCYMDIAADPCFIFVILIDKELITKFAEDVTIKTDCETIHIRIDDYAELIELREAIFQVFKTTPEFMAAKKRRILWEELQTSIYRPSLTTKTNALHATCF